MPDSRPPSPAFRPNTPNALQPTPSPSTKDRSPGSPTSLLPLQPRLPAVGPPTSSSSPFDDEDDNESISPFPGRRSESLDPAHHLALLALAMAFVGSQITNVFAGPSIGVVSVALKFESRASWISTSGGVASACIVPCVGYLQDLIGRRSLFAFGMLASLVGAIVIATAQGFAGVVAGNVIGGVGSGVAELSATAAIAELVPARLRGLYLGLMVGMTMLFAPAVLYVELLSEYASWRWLFWISLIWNGVTTALLAVTYFPMKQTRRGPKASLSSIKEFDFVGVILLIAGVVEILIALQAGGTIHPWDSAYILVQLLVGILLIALLVLWESRGYGQPLVPFRLFRGQRVVGLSFIICFFSGMPYSAALSLGPTIVQSVFGKSGIETGLIALGPSIALVIGAALCNILITTTKGRGREILVVSATVMTAFTGAEAIAAPGRQVLWAVLGSFSSLGIGALLIPMSTVVTLACPQDLIGTAVALTITLRSIGGTIGYSILFNIYKSHVGKGKNPYEGGNPTEGAKLVYLVTIVFCAIPLILSACLPDMRRYMKGRALSRMSTKSFAA